MGATSLGTTSTPSNFRELPSAKAKENSGKFLIMPVRRRNSAVLSEPYTEVFDGKV
jgi:hypothetical protein